MIGSGIGLFSIGSSNGVTIDVVYDLLTSSIQITAGASSETVTEIIPLPAALQISTGIDPIYVGVEVNPTSGRLLLTPLIGGVDARKKSFSAAVNSRSTDEVFIILLTITHDQLTQPIRIASDNLDILSTGQRGVISLGEEFTYLPFEIVLPNLERDTAPRSKISMDNIHREITLALANITTPPQVQVQLCLSSDPDVIEYDLQGFKLTNATYNSTTIEGELNVEYFVNEPFPAPRFTPSRFPGLFRGRRTQVGV